TITGYNVYRGVAAGSLTLLSSHGNVLTYQDAGLTNGVAYYYQVSAQTAAGEGPRSSEVAATPRTQPSAVLNLLATAGAGRVVLTWDAPISDGGATVSGYSVYRGTAPGSSALFATGTTSWSATLTLREGQNTIFVRTTDTSGNVSIATITVTVELAPLTLQGTPSLAIDRLAGGAAVTAAIVVGVYVSSSVASG